MKPLKDKVELLEAEMVQKDDRIKTNKHCNTITLTNRL